MNRIKVFNGFFYYSTSTHTFKYYSCTLNTSLIHTLTPHNVEACSQTHHRHAWSLNSRHDNQHWLWDWLRAYVSSEYKGYCVHYGWIGQSLQPQSSCIKSYFGAKCQSHSVLSHALWQRIVSVTTLATLKHQCFHGSERKRRAMGKVLRK
jgi:hypothetical protein